MLSRNQMMSAQTANAIMMQQQQQQRRLQAGGHHRGTGLHPGGAANPLPTVIPHNSANVESQLLCNYSQYLCRREKVNSHDYCSRHILEEKSAPYKPCNFQYARIHPHRKCPRPALKTDRKDGWVLTKSCHLSGNALARVQRVHEPADLWDITFCTRWFWSF